MRRLFRQFSFPGGIPSHVAPETPGSIHEGGELGYSLAHAYGAAFDNPDLLVVLRRRRRRGRDRAAGRELALEQVPRPGARRRGAADPAPQRLQDRQPDGARPHPATTSCARCCAGYGYAPHFVEGDDPATMHQLHGRDAGRGARRDRRDPARGARAAARRERPRWPMIVLRTPKGWTGPKEVDGLPVEGTCRAHQVPLAELARQPRAPARSSRSGCAATGPRSCSTTTARSRAELAALAPDGRAADERQPARQRRAAAARPASCPTSATTPSTVAEPAARRSSEATRVLGAFLRDVIARATRDNFRVIGPGRDRVEPARRGVRGDRPRLGRPRPLPATTTSRPDGRVMEVLSRAPVPGLAGGLPADRPPRPVQLLRGVHPHRRLDVQPARQVAEGHARHPVAARRSRR